jgi:UDP-2,4-diacetamido-2,4,6-trideoxy-beta-L-altropyranose hydrolase
VADTALFRFDAGAGVGLGHFSRCLSLAEALGHAGIGRVMLVPADGPLEQQVASAGHVAEHRHADADQDGDVDEVIASARRHRCRWVVVDSYRFPAAALGRVRDAGFVVVAIDDLAREPLPAQIVVNGGAQAPRLAYASASGDTRFLLGAQYALLRPEFWAQPGREIGAPVRHVLLTLGGSDPDGGTLAILKTIDAHQATFAVSVVIGPFFENSDRLETAIRGSRHDVDIARAPATLLPLMRAADLAIAGGGQTLYELASTGTPTIAVRVADNQRDSMNALAEAGVVVHGGALSHGTPEPVLGDRFAALLEDVTLRQRLSRTGQTVVDGRGAERVVMEMRREA